MEWKFETISGNYLPRQFEYHPDTEDILFGTMSGDICYVNSMNRQKIKNLGSFGKSSYDTILGICWFKNCGNDRFITGSSKGNIICGQTSILSSKGYIVNDYPQFDKLTSVHLNYGNDSLLVSGYSTSARIYDVQTGAVIHEYNDIHSDHINISRFSNLSPHIFLTSSFDKSIKSWDTRVKCIPSQPLYTVQCNTGVVMINFSSDDVFFLASALDNEINQYFLLDGRKHLSYNIPKTGLSGNFSRSYYSKSARYVLTGSCEENSFKVMCSYTGEVLTAVEMYNGKKDDSIYIQSLRGSPVDDNTVCVLTNYRDIQRRELIIARNVNKSCETNIQYLSSSNQLVDKETEIKNYQNRGSDSETCASSIDNIRNQYYSYSYIKDLSELRIEGRNLFNFISRIENTNLGIDLKLDIESMVNDSILKIHPKIVQSNILILYKLVPKTITDKRIKSDNYSILKFGIDIQIGSEDYHLFLFPVHQFIICARCPELQNNSIIPNSFVNIYINGDSKAPIEVFDLKQQFPNDLLYLFPVILDYLYYGNSAIDLLIIRYICFSIIFHTEASEGRPINKIFPSIDVNEFYDSLIKILDNDQVWRDPFLNNKFIDILKDLLDIGICLNLSDVQTIIESYLSKSIQVNSYFVIYDLSVIYRKNKLRNFCLKFFINHFEFISSYHHQCISFKLFYNLSDDKEFGTKDDKNYLRKIAFVVNDNSFNHSANNLTNMLEDVVILINHFSVEVLNREGFRIRKLIIDTLSKEQILSQHYSVSNNHSELFDVYESAFGIIENFNKTVSINDECPFLYGSENISSSICLPKYMNHSVCRYSNDVIMFFGGMNKERFHGSNRVLIFNESTNDFKYIACSGDNIAASSSNFAISLAKVNTRYIVMFAGFSKVLDHAKRYSSLAVSSTFDSLSLKLNKFEFLTNLPVDVLYSNTTKSETDYKEGIDLDKSIPQEAIFVLDCCTLSWFTPKIKIDLSRNQNINLSSALTSEELKQSIFNSIKHRAGQTVVPLYSEDIKYRCKFCLLSEDFAKCCCTTSSIKEIEQNNRCDPCWVVQFGGYCTKNQLIKSDINVLVYNDNRTDFLCSSDDINTFELVSARVSGTIPTGRFSHTAVILPHSTNIFNIGVDGKKSIHTSSHTRMLVYGGISQENDMDELLSLRINHNHITSINRIDHEKDFHWENVTVNGPDPGKRHGHSLTYLEEKEIIILYGGVYHNRSALHSDRAMSDIWCAKIENLVWSSDERSDDFGICVRWEQINTTGVPPSPRSRHSCTFNKETGLLHIFGGIEENINEIESNSEDELMSLDENQKDMIAHALHISINRNSKSNQIVIEGKWINNSKSSRFIRFPCEPIVEIPSCSLSHSLSVLMNDNISKNNHNFPDLTFNVLPTTNIDLLDKENSLFLSYSSIVAKRWEWVNTILLSNMKETTSMKITLNNNDVRSFSSLLFYLYTDKLVFNDIDDLCRLMELANQYNVVKLIKLCEHAFIRYSNDDNIFQLLEYADIFNLEVLNIISVSKLLRRNNILSLLEDESCDARVIENQSESSHSIPTHLKIKLKDYFHNECHIYKNNS